MPPGPVSGATYGARHAGLLVVSWAGPWSGPPNTNATNI